LLFQVVSHRYERGSIIVTTNKPFKRWAQIFNNDSTLTAALLDRMLHYAEVCVIEGPSFRGKYLVETYPILSIAQIYEG
jgi:DNA replication protein DnaC